RMAELGHHQGGCGMAVADSAQIAKPPVKRREQPVTGRRAHALRTLSAPEIGAGGAPGSVMGLTVAEQALERPVADLRLGAGVAHAGLGPAQPAEIEQAVD